MVNRCSEFHLNVTCLPLGVARPAEEADETKDAKSRKSKVDPLPAACCIGLVKLVSFHASNRPGFVSLSQKWWEPSVIGS